MISPWLPNKNQTNQFGMKRIKRLLMALLALVWYVQ
jgi:hypothetical protein